MLRVGLTGGLGSGKSAVGAVFAEGGAHVFSADEIGRSLMQPGQAVYTEIVRSFGPQVVTASGMLDRRELAAQAFEYGRLAELNAIVHPAVLRAQEEILLRVEAEDTGGIAVVESALIFEVGRSAGISRSVEISGSASASRSLAPEAYPTAWRHRFDRLVLVTAPEALKVSRYVARMAGPDADPLLRDTLARDARLRLAAQLPDEEKVPFCDYVIDNGTTLVLLRRRAQAVLAALRQG